MPGVPNIVLKSICGNRSLGIKGRDDNLVTESSATSGRGGTASYLPNVGDYQRSLPWYIAQAACMHHLIVCGRDPRVAVPRFMLGIWQQW